MWFSKKVTKCNNCDASISDTDNFCPFCGIKTTYNLLCPKCSFSLVGDAVFCSHCGNILIKVKVTENDPIITKVID